jgi:hypothetical protein
VANGFFATSGCTGRMLVCLNNGGIHALPFTVDVALEKFENHSNAASFGPPIEAAVSRLPWPKLCWQVAPWAANTGTPEDCLQCVAHAFSEVSFAVNDSSFKGFHMPSNSMRLVISLARSSLLAFGL